MTSLPTATCQAVGKAFADSQLYSRQTLTAPSTLTEALPTALTYGCRQRLCRPLHSGCRQSLCRQPSVRAVGKALVILPTAL